MQVTSINRLTATSHVVANGEAPTPDTNMRRSTSERTLTPAAISVPPCSRPSRPSPSAARPAPALTTAARDAQAFEQAGAEGCSDRTEG